MRSFHMLKEDLLRAAGNMADLLTTARCIPGLSGAIRSDWEKTCHHISRSISGDRVRVAVVGSIKSGKSTFINAFLKGDYLKRGAGVVTSIVTRVRKGKELKFPLLAEFRERGGRVLSLSMPTLPRHHEPCCARPPAPTRSTPRPRTPP